MGKLDRFIALARKAAQKSTMEFRHGAVLVKGGSVISTGCNHDRTCLEGREIPSLHAEVDCLLRRSRNAVKGSDLYIVRLTNTGLAASKPCEGCLQTLREFGVKNVYYSTRNGIEMQKVAEDERGYMRPYGHHVHREYYTGPAAFPVPD